METKISIAVSQTDQDSFNLVINKTTLIVDQDPKTENTIKAGITLDEVKELINSL